VFIFTGSSTTICCWLSASSVSVTFNVTTSTSVATSTDLSIGDSVVLIGGTLKALCSGPVATCDLNPVTTTMSVIALAPLNPSTPTVVINAPLFLGSCTNLTLDATASYGNGGRLYTAVMWTVSATSYGVSDVIVDASSIQSYLNAYSALHQASSPISIGANSLTKATYIFTLSLTNFFGLSSFKTVAIDVSSDPNLPVLSIIGTSYRVIVASSTLQILSLATLSTCVSGGTTVTYTWTVKKDGLEVAIPSISLNPSQFSLAAYALAVGNSYIGQCRTRGRRIVILCPNISIVIIHNN
jgi:hypothetical protein